VNWQFHVNASIRNGDTKKILVALAFQPLAFARETGQIRARIADSSVNVIGATMDAVNEYH
jgi:hypothetical protein